MKPFGYCKDWCKSGRSQLHDLQKLCYSFGLGCYRKLRENPHRDNPDISIAAEEKRGCKPLRPEEVAGRESEVETNDADLTSDKNFFIISFLCCNDSDDSNNVNDAKAKLAEVEVGSKASSTE
jgi:hypothetical protein